MKNFLSKQNTFLLRVWRSSSEWRISLEDPMTGERNGFSKLETLMEFLKNAMERPPQSKEEDCSTSTDTNNQK
jgi:hypothetical protein